MKNGNLIILKPVTKTVFVQGEGLKQSIIYLRIASDNASIKKIANFINRIFEISHLL